MEKSDSGQNKEQFVQRIFLDGPRPLRHRLKCVFDDLLKQKNEKSTKKTVYASGRCPIIFLDFSKDHFARPPAPKFDLKCKHIILHF